jgi:hypothetical protein
MGNDVEVGVRGDVDVECAKLISAASEESLEKILATLEEEALIDRTLINDGPTLLAKLESFSKNDKQGILDRAYAGEFN